MKYPTKVDMPLNRETKLINEWMEFSKTLE